MGWNTVGTLEIEKSSYTPPHDKGILLTRGGLEGVKVIYNEVEISIPREMLLDLFAEELVNNEISKLEQMSSQEAINYFTSK